MDFNDEAKFCLNKICKNHLYNIRKKRNEQSLLYDF